MRSSRLLFATLTLLTSLPAAVCAQAPTGDPPVAMAQEPPALSGDTLAPRRGPSFSSRLLTAAGGAAVGAGLGFFASQLVRGDWDEGQGGGGVNRGAWAAIGGGLGFTLGFRYPLGVASGSPEAPSGLPVGRARLGADEIRGAGVSNALEAIRTLRPEWLSLRGTQVWRQAAPGSASDPRAAPEDLGALDANPLPVYLDNQPLGDLSALSSVNAHDIGAIYFLNASQATLRWGGGHGRGAILIITAG